MENFFIPLEGSRLIIRTLTTDDTADYYNFASNPSVAKYMSWSPHQNIQESKGLIDRTIRDYEDYHIYTLGIIHKQDRRLIGAIGLSRRNLTADTCEVWYALAYEYWHQGLMAEALKMFCDYLIANDKKTIIATHIDENENSAKVMLKAGFKRDTQYDGPYIIKGKEVNLIGYSLKTGK